MEFENRIYSILLVSNAEKFNTSFVELTMGTCYEVLGLAPSIQSAKRQLLEQHYDFVVVNSPIKEESGTRLISELAEKSNTVSLIIARAETYESVSSHATSCGAFAMLKPVSAQGIRNALDWMASEREKLRHVEKKSLTLEEKMAEIKLVNRAKWMLIDRLKMTEEESHKYIEKQAMDRCISKKEIAESIIKTYEL